MVAARAGQSVRYQCTDGVVITPNHIIYVCCRALKYILFAISITHLWQQATTLPTSGYR
jgi:hypothetical protein